MDPDESTGKVVVLEGSGMCPPENKQGNSNWKRMVNSIENGTISEQRRVLDEIFSEVNYVERGWKRSEFDLDKFDLEDARKAVVDALNSHGSVAGRGFTTRLGEGATLAEMMRQKGQTIKRTPDVLNPSSGYWEETVSTKRDNLRKTACANCGSPNDLKVCVLCRQRYYCSKDCQKVGDRFSLTFSDLIGCSFLDALERAA